MLDKRRADVVASFYLQNTFFSIRAPPPHPPSSCSVCHAVFIELPALPSWPLVEHLGGPMTVAHHPWLLRGRLAVLNVARSKQFAVHRESVPFVFDPPACTAAEVLKVNRVHIFSCVDARSSARGTCRHSWPRRERFPRTAPTTTQLSQSFSLAPRHWARTLVPPTRRFGRVPPVPAFIPQTCLVGRLFSCGLSVPDC